MWLNSSSLIIMFIIIIVFKILIIFNIFFKRKSISNYSYLFLVTPKNWPNYKEISGDYPLLIKTELLFGMNVKNWYASSYKLIRWNTPMFFLLKSKLKFLNKNNKYESKKQVHKRFVVPNSTPVNKNKSWYASLEQTLK